MYEVNIIFCFNIASISSFDISPLRVWKDFGNSVSFSKLQFIYL